MTGTGRVHGLGVVNCGEHGGISVTEVPITLNSLHCCRPGACTVACRRRSGGGGVREWLWRGAVNLPAKQQLFTQLIDLMAIPRQSQNSSYRLPGVHGRHL